MSTVQQYEFQGQRVRTLTDEHGEPWFVLVDVAAALGVTNARNIAARLDEDMKGVRPVDTLGGVQNLLTVNEAGLYDAILRSDKPTARPFRRWVTSEVLPAIRRTGAYRAPATPELSGPELLARAVLEAQAVIAAKDAQIESMAPKADAFDDFLTAQGSYAVGDAAKILTRAGVVVGQNRLFRNLDTLGWTFRKGLKRHASQRAVDDPQIRLTGKGIHRLRDLLQAPLELEVAA